MATNFGILLNGFTQLDGLDGGGYDDALTINGDVNLSVISGGLGTDSIKIYGGGLQGALVLLDGLAGLGGYDDGSKNYGKDVLYVYGNCNLALVSCGANDDSIIFYSSVTALNINGGDGNDKIKFAIGALGTYKPDMSNPLDPPDFQFLDIPLGVIAGGRGNDTITFNAGSSSYGVIVLGGDPFCSGGGSTGSAVGLNGVTPLPGFDGDDIINFEPGKAAVPTWFKQSMINLGDGADRINFGDYMKTEKVIIMCGGDNVSSDGDVDVLNISRGGVKTSSFVNTTIVDFGDEDKAILGGTTYVGAAGRTALTDAGFTLVNHWI